MGEGEFDYIERLMAPLATHSGTFGLKNDACVIKPLAGFELVITTDTLVEGVHYLENCPPELVARKLVGVNLSDIAAMGARPIGYTLNCTFTAKHDFEWCKTFANELGTLQNKYEFTLFGGDTTKSTGAGVFSLTAYGEVETGSAFRRDSAQTHDLIYVSGTIGDSAFGLDVAKGNLSEKTGFLLDRYNCPVPRISLGRALLPYVKTCMDISDGLGADLSHICHHSQKGAKIYTQNIPLSEPVKLLLEKDSSLISKVLSGGDDYELLFSIDKKHKKNMDYISAELGIKLTQIGTFTDDLVIHFHDDQNNPIVLDQMGYRHF